jgi:hypothetical protein
MRKDIPPRDVVILTYFLSEEPVIDKGPLPPDQWGTTLDYMYDEFELVRLAEQKTYAQSILFGNGWEISLRFSDVQVTLAEPVYPLPNTTLMVVPTASTSKSA